MIKVHPEQIPECENNTMGRSLFSIIEHYFSDPDHMREFEEWKKQNPSPQKTG